MPRPYKKARGNKKGKRENMDAQYQQQVLSEIIDVLGTGPDLTMDGIQSELGALYAQYANDEWATTTISNTWAKVLIVAQTARNAIDIAAAAREVAEQTRAQRDTALRAMVELQAAANTLDRSHPVVDSIAEGIEEQMAEEAEYSASYGLMWVAQNMVTLAELPISQEEADVFIGLIANDALENVDPTVAAGLRSRIAKFIRSTVAQYSAAAEVWAEQHPYTDISEIA